MMMIIGFGVTITFLILCFGLLIYHLYLVITNQTTWEHGRDHENHKSSSYYDQVPESVLPFNRGICFNLMKFYYDNSVCSICEYFGLDIFQSFQMNQVILVPPLDENGDYQGDCLAHCC